MATVAEVINQMVGENNPDPPQEEKGSDECDIYELAQRYGCSAKDVEELSRELDKEEAEAARTMIDCDAKSFHVCSLSHLTSEKQKKLKNAIQEHIWIMNNEIGAYDYLPMAETSWQFERNARNYAKSLSRGRRGAKLFKAQSMTIPGQCGVASLEVSSGVGFKYWLRLNITPNTPLLIPLQNNDRLSGLIAKSKSIPQYIVKPDSIQICFSNPMKMPLQVKNIIGIDLGYTNMVTLSNGSIYGEQFWRLLKSANKAPPGSQVFRDRREAIHNEIDKIVISIVEHKPDVLMMENSSKFKDSMARKAKREEKSTGKDKTFHKECLNLWPLKYFFERLSHECRKRRIWLFTVPAQNTSKMCSHCGHNVKRSDDKKSVQCTYTECKYFNKPINADISAAINVKKIGENMYLRKTETSEYIVKKESTKLAFRFYRKRDVR